MSDAPASFKPSAYYYRAELRAARTKKEILEVALHLVCELEEHKAWERMHGLIPPKWFITPSERLAKAPGLVIPFPSKEGLSETEE